jgi:ABC-2 type transport system ATP-binding protein
LAKQTAAHRRPTAAKHTASGRQLSAVATKSLNVSLLNIHRVTKKYHKLTALDNISLHIERGEVLGLLGPNGAGKTTLIKLIAGILFPTSGQLEPTGTLWPSIGYKPERLVFPNHLRVSHYLEMVATVCNIKPNDIENTVLESLARVNLLASANKPIRTLSKGMRQRLGLAQALIGNPALLLLDEPSNGLDPAGQVEILHFIEELREAGKTIVLSSHRLNEVTHVCTQLVILHHGKIHYQNKMSVALAMQPQVIIRTSGALDGRKELLRALHNDVMVDGDLIVLRNEAMYLRRQVLATLLEWNYDILGVEQKRTTLAEIYAEATQ